MGNADTEPSVRGASGPADHPGRAGLVAAALVRAQYRNISDQQLPSTPSFAAFLCLALRETVSPERLAWLAERNLPGRRHRLLLWHRFHKIPLHAANTLRWRHIATLGSGANGFTWGVGGIVLYAAS